jgi:hypothetical protein
MSEAKKINTKVSKTEPTIGGKNYKETRKKYLNRFDHVKKGKEAYANAQWDIAIKSYRDYLQVMIDIKTVSIRQFSPKNFDHSKELAEMLVISHVFWDLATLYDRCPPLKNEFLICMDMYLRFTVGFKYHNANLASFKRYITVKEVKNKQTFNKAYNTLLASSKKCFIATLCFGNESHITNDYRAFKKTIMKTDIGIKFVDIYYHYSPILINKLESKPLLKILSINLIFKPILFLGYCIRKIRL